MPASSKRVAVAGNNKIPKLTNAQDLRAKIQAKAAARGSNDPTVQQWKSRLNATRQAAKAFSNAGNAIGASGAANAAAQGAGNAIGSSVNAPDNSGWGNVASKPAPNTVASQPPTAPSSANQPPFSDYAKNLQDLLAGFRNSGAANSGGTNSGMDTSSGYDRNGGAAGGSATPDQPNLQPAQPDGAASYANLNTYDGRYTRLMRQLMQNQQNGKSPWQVNNQEMVEQYNPYTGKMVMMPKGAII